LPEKYQGKTINYHPVKPVGAQDELDELGKIVQAYKKKEAEAKRVAQ
jgi:hypothetical protein